MTMLRLEIFEAVDWTAWLRALRSAGLKGSPSAAHEARVDAVCRRAADAGRPFSDRSEVAECVAALEGHRLAVGPVPADPRQTEVPWALLTHFEVVERPGAVVDARVLAVLAVAGERAEPLMGRVDAVCEERTPDGRLMFRLLAVSPSYARVVPAVKLTANIDDMTAEFLGYLVDRLLDAGARDAWLTPAVMKKTRPATTVHVLVDPLQEASVLEVLLRESSTLGVRRELLDTYVLERRMQHVRTPYGTVAVKEGLLNGTVRSAHPEFEDCARLARRAGVPLATVYAAAVDAWRHPSEGGGEGGG